MELVRKQTYITPEQDRRLKQAAAREHATEAEILRRALDRWLATDGNRDERDPFEPLIAMVSGPEEVNHDDIHG